MRCYEGIYSHAMLQTHTPNDATLLRGTQRGDMLQRHTPRDATLLRGTQRGDMLQRHIQSGAMIWGYKTTWTMVEGQESD